ncbi:alpha/beta-hydrolase, partial [Coprinopsis marcescibilis]
DDPFRQFDLYPIQSDVPRPLLVFVHGGAWRSEDKKDHAILASKLASATNCPVFVPNYRLTSKLPQTFHHPGHSEDLLQFLEFLLQWKPDISGIASTLDPRSIYLIGHSCSAHMLTSIILDSDFITPSLKPSAQLLDAAKCVILSEGIYDLDLLVARFPNYRAWFIDEAFGTRASYSPFNVNQYRLRNPNTVASWQIIHSTGDELIDPPQSEAMYSHLCQLYGERAKHLISRNYDTLKDGHDDILRGDEYVALVQSFL